MQIPKLRGIIPPMITPLKGDDQIDREGTVRLTEHILAGGIHALFLLGTTGEAQSLSYKCRYDFVELVCRQVAGRVPVLVGITDTSLDESVKLAAHAAACGAVGVVAAPPYYFAPSQQELIEYYTALADALPLPLYLYNMPSHVKVFLEPATVKTLANHPNIIGLKDSSANMTYFQTLLYHLGDNPDFSLYVGPEELTGECVLLGADGGVNGGANIFPELYVAMYDAACAHDIARVREIQRIGLYRRKIRIELPERRQMRTFAAGSLRRLPLVPLPEIPHRGARPDSSGTRSAGRQLQRITHNNQPSWR